MPRPRSTNYDLRIGQRVRELRIIAGLSQEQLAVRCGVTYQQMHKRERGINRISAGTLVVTAAALGVPITSFFDGLTDVLPVTDHQERFMLELARQLQRMKPGARSCILELARLLAEPSALTTIAAEHERLGPREPVLS